MNSLLKKALWIGGGAAVISSIVGFQKFNKIKAIFDQMDIDPHWISKPNISLANIKFNLDVKLTNNSVDNLFVTGASVAQLKQIDIYYKNVFLATVNVQLTEISIPAKSFLIIKNIPVRVSTGTALSNISAFRKPNIADFRIIGIIEALGATYEVGN